MPITVPASPGVYVFPDSTAISAAAIAPATFNTCYCIVTGTTGTNNQLVKIASVAEFTTAFGPSPSLNYITTLFDIYPSINLFCVKASSSTASNYAAVCTGAFNKDLSPGFLICPEGFELLTVQADRTTLMQAMDTAAQTYRWVALIDSAVASNTPALAGAESDLYRTGTRYTAMYYGTGLSAIAAAQGLRGFAEFGQYTPPAGKYEIPSAILTRHSITTRVATQTDQDTLAGKRINAMRTIANRVLLYDAMTLSTDASQGIGVINSLVASNVTERTLERSYDVFKVLNDATVEDLLRSMIAVMDGLARDGAYRRNVQISDGRVLTSGFTVERPTIPASTTAEVVIGYVPIGTLRQVVIRTVRLTAVN